MPRVEIDLGASGLRPARRDRPWTTRELELYDAHIEAQRNAGQVLPSSREEADALARMDDLRWREDEEEALARLSPSERISRARRKRSGFRGGTLNSYAGRHFG